VLLRDLTRQARQFRAGRSTRDGKLEQAFQLTELIRLHKQNDITPEEFQQYRADFLGPRRRSKTATTDPVEPGEVGPNGYRVGYTKDGDKVEWVPDDDDPAKEWPLVLRRNDKAILKGLDEFWDKVWWKRHQNWLYRIDTGEEILTEEQKPILERLRKQLVV
jgi:hypothetical protein